MDPDATGKIEFASFYSAMAAFVKPQYGRAVLDKAFDEISGYDEQKRARAWLPVVITAHCMLEEVRVRFREIKKRSDTFRQLK